MSKFAWVTLTTNDTYSLGALVLAHSLRRVGTVHQLAVLVTPTVSESMRSQLKEVYNVVQEVNVLDSGDAANLALLARPELGVTFTKLHCWRLVQFEKCVFLDADTLVLQSCDELFEREELSAAPDVSWPDCFNSGVFVYQPSMETFAKIAEFAVKHGSFDGGDQGLLNLYFGDWAQSDIKKHLPFIYNVAAYASYCYLPAFKQFRDKIKILHFAGKMKPWLIQFNSENRTANTPSEYAHAADLIQFWWNIFCDYVHQKLTDNMPEHFGGEQPHHHHHHNHHHQDHPPPPSYCGYGIIKEFRDPWEDYYENLAQQNNNSSNNNEDNSTNQNNNNNYNDNGANTHSDQADNWSAEPEPHRAADNNANSDFYQQQQHQEQHEQHYEQHYEQQQKQHEQHYEHHYEQQQQEQQQEQHTEAAISRDPSANWQDQSQPTNDFSTNATQMQRSTSVDLSTNDDDHENGDRNESKAPDYETLFPRTDTALSEDWLSEDWLSAGAAITRVDPSAQQSAPSNEAGLAGALSKLRLGEQRTPEQDAYEQLMRRQCWESGQIDYSGRDSFENIWKKITQTLETKPATPAPKDEEEKSGPLTSAQIQDGKIVVDPVTKAKTQYKLIDGGYEVITTTPQPNGTLKTQVQTFWDPKPVSEEDLKKEAANKKLIKSRLGKEIRIDKNTTMLTREIEGGYEEVYTVIKEDGTRSMRTKTFYDSVPEEFPDKGAPAPQDKKKKTVVRKSSVDSTDSTESRKIVQRKDQQSNFKHETTVEESRRVTQKSEYTENNRMVRKDSLQEQNIKSITQNTGDSKDTKKKTKKPKGNIPPPPPDFLENDTTTVSSMRVPGGVQYTYSTQLDSGKTITTSKTVYEEEEVEMTEEEIRQYKKTLKDAEKHKNITTAKKLRSESGTKKVVPSENPGEVTTVETIKIEGGTEYHYTTVTAEGIVKKAVKTVYDPVPSQGGDESEEEIIEDYEEEIIEPGEKNIKTIETVKQLPKKFQEEVTITHERKEKKVKKSMMISH